MTEKQEINELETDIANMSLAEIIQEISKTARFIKEYEQQLPLFREIKDEPLSLFLSGLKAEVIEDWCLEYNAEIDAVLPIVTFPDENTKLLFMLRWANVRGRQESS